MVNSDFIYESNINTKILNSKLLNQKEKESFLKFITYFTPKEIEELKFII